MASPNLSSLRPSIARVIPQSSHVKKPLEPHPIGRGYPSGNRPAPEPRLPPKYGPGRPNPRILDPDLTQQNSPTNGSDEMLLPGRSQHAIYNRAGSGSRAADDLVNDQQIEYPTDEYYSDTTAGETTEAIESDPYSSSEDDTLEGSGSGEEKLEFTMALSRNQVVRNSSPKRVQSEDGEESIPELNENVEVDPATASVYTDEAEEAHFQPDDTGSIHGGSEGVALKESEAEEEKVELAKGLLGNETTGHPSKSEVSREAKKPVEEPDQQLQEHIERSEPEESKEDILDHIVPHDSGISLDGEAFDSGDFNQLLSPSQHTTSTHSGSDIDEQTNNADYGLIQDLTDNSAGSIASDEAEEGDSENDTSGEIRQDFADSEPDDEFLNSLTALLDHESALVEFTRVVTEFSQDQGMDDASSGILSGEEAEDEFDDDDNSEPSESDGEESVLDEEMLEYAVGEDSATTLSEGPDTSREEKSVEQMIDYGNELAFSKNEPRNDGWVGSDSGESVEGKKLVKEPSAEPPKIYSETQAANLPTAVVATEVTSLQPPTNPTFGGQAMSNSQLEDTDARLVSGVASQEISLNTPAMCSKEQMLEGQADSAGEKPGLVKGILDCQEIDVGRAEDVIGTQAIEENSNSQVGIISASSAVDSMKERGTGVESDSLNQSLGEAEVLPPNITSSEEIPEHTLETRILDQMVIGQERRDEADGSIMESPTNQDTNMGCVESVTSKEPSKPNIQINISIGDSSIQQLESGVYLEPSAQFECMSPTSTQSLNISSAEATSVLSAHTNGILQSTNPFNPEIGSEAQGCDENIMSAKGLDTQMHDITISDVQTAAADAILEPQSPPILPTEAVALPIVKVDVQDDSKAMNEAIVAQQNAVATLPDDHPDKPSRLKALAASLSDRFVSFGNYRDIKDAVLAQKQVATLTPHEHVSWVELGNLSMRCYERFGDLEALDGAIDAYLKAESLVPSNHTDEPQVMKNLAATLALRFERTGDHQDIEDAIAVRRRIVELSPNDHVDKPSCLSELGDVLKRRFELQGDFKDIGDAIDAQIQAVDLISDGHPDKLKYLDVLGSLLRQRNDPEESIDPDPSLSKNPPSSIIETFRAKMQDKHGLLEEPSDVDLAILVQKQAFDLTPPDSGSKMVRMSALGAAYGQRYERFGAAEDINCAIACQQQALDLTPDGHANKPSMLINLGNSCVQRFKQSGTPADQQHAIQLFRTAATYITGNPLDHFAAAQSWAEFCPDSLEAHHVLIQLIPRVAWMSRTIQQRYEDLKTIGDTALNAAAAACNVEGFFLALEWLEQGRSIVWGQILHLRSPKQTLRALYPQLADELDKIALELETTAVDNDHANDGSNKGDLLDCPTGSTILPTQMKDMSEFCKRPNWSASHHSLAQRWEDMLQRVRALPEFNDFLRPKRASTLIDASTQNGVTVVVQVSKYGCYALILRPRSQQVDHLRLHKLSMDGVTKAQSLFSTSLSSTGVRSGGSMRKVNQGHSEPMMRGKGVYGLEKILRMLWVGVALPIVTHLGYVHSPTSLPHITWCLTGPLASLPLHAAGVYTTSAPETKLYNYVVSSYTPSLTALLQSSTRTPPKALGVLAVTQAETPGLSVLPGTITEVNQVQALIDSKELEKKFTFSRMDGKAATVKIVEKGIHSHNWIHLSCHASQNIVPTRSAFHLENGTLELASIMREPPEYAELAYLSACQTAAGDSKLPDESVHLAAAIFHSGFRSVIATLWSIRDADAPLVASVFYAQLLKNPGAVAQALHEAVGELRNKVGETNFLSWVPFIHIGH